MTLAQVLALINSEIVPNNNNEITANVLRPILVEMLQQPNDLIGLLSNLTTSANTNLVDAINELKNDLSQVNGINVFQGIGNPNNNGALNPDVADFYSQLDVSNNVVGLWIYNGNEWIYLNDKYVSFDENQLLTAPQQQTARENIKAAFADDVAALQGITLEADQANAIVYVKDGNGQQLASLNVGFLNNEGTTFRYNDVTKKLELLNDQGEVLSSIPVSDFVTNVVSSANWNGTTPSKLDFKDSAGTILFSIDYSMSNINGLVAALGGKADKDGANITDIAQWKTTLGIDDKVSKYGDIMGGSLENTVTEGVGSYTFLSKTHHYYNDTRYHFLAQTDSNNGYVTVFSVDHSGLITTRIHGNSAQWNQAYNERVTQFNTTYTTSVYTFSLLQGNGTTKSTSFQVGTSYFTIDSNGVLQLNVATAQKINNSTDTKIGINGSPATLKVGNVYLSEGSGISLDQTASGFLISANVSNKVFIITQNDTVVDAGAARTQVNFKNSTPTGVRIGNGSNGAVLTILNSSVTGSPTFNIDMNVLTRGGTTVATFSVSKDMDYSFFFSDEHNAWVEDLNIKKI